MLVCMSIGKLTVINLLRHPVVIGLLVLVIAVVFIWGVKLYQLKRSIDTNAAYWSEIQEQDGGLLYVAIGDSAAQGIGASKPAKGYVGLIAERLRSRTGQPVTVVNLSSSGARIDDVMERQIPALQALNRKPDVVTVAIGGNDIRVYDRQTFTSQIKQLNSALPAGTFVADVPYFMHGHWERDAQQAADLMTANVVANNLVPVPLHDALREQGWQAMLTQFAADWFHPNDRGHEVWANAFWAEMEDHLTLLDSPVN